MARKLTVGKISKISIYQRSTGRWIVTWYDEQGPRHHTTCATRKEAEVIQRQKRADLERHRETRFDVDDRQMFNPGAGSRRCEIRMAPWLVLGGLAGIRTDGEIFRIRWECFKWNRRIIDLDLP